MLALCLDTNTYSAYRNADPDAKKLIAAVDQLWLPATVLGELRAGFLNGSKSVANELLLQQFMDLPYVAVAPTTEATSRHYAQVHHLQPLSDRTMPGKTSLDDLAVVCANCHVMIHRGGNCRALTNLIPQHLPT